jgi:hypothetical protein
MQPPDKQREIVTFIYALKNEQNRAERIASLMKNKFKWP